MESYIAQFKVCVLDLSQTSSNHVNKQLKLFTMSQDYVVNAENLTSFNRLSDGLVKSLYVFKLDSSAHIYGCSHGLYVTFQGVVPRRQVKNFLSKVIQFIFEQHTPPNAFVSVKPKVQPTQSTFDYLLSLYRQPRNLLAYIANGHDVMANNTVSLNQIDHTEVNVVLHLMRAITSKVLDNILSLTALYNGTILANVLRMSPKEFYLFMRQTTFKGLAQRVLNEAHSIALQDSQFTTEQIQQLSLPLCRQNVVSFLLTDQNLRRLQEVIAGVFGYDSIHPSPLSNVEQYTARHQGVFDVMLFDSRFLFSLLMCARWFAKFYSRQDSEGSLGDRSNLVLYGASGAGKSLIISAISSNISTYKFIATSKFQNPEIISSSLITIDEFDVEQLVNANYKALFDINSALKIDFKNMHPSNVGKDVPVIVSTNEDLFQTLTALPQKKAKYNQASVDAALRRLYPVPFKMPRYNKAHGTLPQSHRYYELLEPFQKLFQQEPFVLDRVFNFLVAFSMFQNDITFLHANPSFVQYALQTVDSFKSTMFGRFYQRYKNRIDTLLVEIENLMGVQDLNDTEYCNRVSMNAGVLQSLVQKFMQALDRQDTEFQNVVVDISIPQPLKVYYSLKKAHISWSEHETESLQGTSYYGWKTQNNQLPFALESDDEEVGNDLIKLNELQSFFTKDQTNQKTYEESKDDCF